MTSQSSETFWLPGYFHGTQSQLSLPKIVFFNQFVIETVPKRWTILQVKMKLGFCCKMTKLFGTVTIKLIDGTVTLLPQAFKETRGMTISCEQVWFQCVLIRPITFSIWKKLKHIGLKLTKATWGSFINDVMQFLIHITQSSQPLALRLCNATQYLTPPLWPWYHLWNV